MRPFRMSKEASICFSRQNARLSPGTAEARLEISCWFESRLQIKRLEVQPDCPGVEYLLVQTLWARKLTRLQREFASPHIHTYFGQKTPSFLSRVPTIRAHTSICDQFSRT